MPLELTPEISTLSVLLIGAVFGLQHAVEGDHLAAVSAIVSERKSVLSATVIGGFWGVGHTISLFLVGAVVIFLKLQISESLEAKLEAVVGAMLVLLGLNVLRRLFHSDKIHAHTHDHEGHTHTHIHTHKNEKAEKSHHFLRFSPRSVLVGMIHGLAGSAGLMLLVLPAISSSALALLYILIFGAGSIIGMMLMSVLLGLPFHFTAGRFLQLNRAVRLGAGFFSFGLGLHIIYEKLW